MHLNRCSFPCVFRMFRLTVLWFTLCSILPCILADPYGTQKPPDSASYGSINLNQDQDRQRGSSGRTDARFMHQTSRDEYPEFDSYPSSFNQEALDSSALSGHQMNSQSRGYGDEFMEHQVAPQLPPYTGPGFSQQQYTHTYGEDGSSFSPSSPARDYGYVNYDHPKGDSNVRSPLVNEQVQRFSTDSVIRDRGIWDNNNRDSQFHVPSHSWGTESVQDRIPSPSTNQYNTDVYQNGLTIPTTPTDRYTVDRDTRNDQTYRQSGIPNGGGVHGVGNGRQTFGQGNAGFRQDVHFPDRHTFPPALTEGGTGDGGMYERTGITNGPSGQGVGLDQLVLAQGSAPYAHPRQTSAPNERLPVTPSSNQDYNGIGDGMPQTQALDTNNQQPIEVPVAVRPVAQTGVGGQDALALDSSAGSREQQSFSGDHGQSQSSVDSFATSTRPNDVPDNQVDQAIVPPPENHLSSNGDDPNHWVPHQTPLDTMPAKVEVPLVFENGGYYGKITVGTPRPEIPEQKFKVLFDTASRDIWLLSSEACAKGYCPDGTKSFDGSMSATYSTEEKQVQNVFGNGVTVAGILSHDNIQLGEGADKILLKGQGFVESTKLKNAFPHHDAIFGLLFLSPPFLADFPEPALYQMTRQFGRAPVFSFYLNRNNPKDSKLVFGGGEDEFVVEKYTDHPLQKVNFEGRSGYYNGWNVAVPGLFVEKRRQEPIQISVPSNLYGYPELAEEYIVGPQLFIQQLKTQIFNFAPFPFNGEDFIFACPGNMMENVYTKLPDVTFVIDTSRYILTAYDYIKEHEGRCQSLFKGRIDYDHILFGRVFMMKYHIRFDHANKRLQIAEARQDNSFENEGLRVMISLDR